MASTASRRSTWRKRAGLAAATGTGVVVATLLSLLVLVGVLPVLLGARVVSLEGHGPASGSLAVVTTADPQPGDIVLADAGRGHDLWRVAEVSGSRLVTVGLDGSSILLSSANSSDVVRYRLPAVGAVASLLATPTGMFFAAAALLLLVAGRAIGGPAHRQSSRGVFTP